MKKQWDVASTGGRVGLEVTEEMKRSEQVVCKHGENVSQGQNEMREQKCERRDWGGDTRANRTTGTHQNTGIRTGGRNIVKTASAVFLLMFMF